MSNLIPPTAEPFDRFAAPKAPRSIHRQLTLFSLGLVLPTAIVASILVAWNVADGRNSAEQALLADARAMAGSIDQDVARHIAFAEALASSDAVAAHDWVAVRARISRLELGPEAWVAISDSSGRRLLNTAPTVLLASPQVSLPRPANVQRALQSNRPAVSDLFVGRATGAPVVSVDAAVRGDPDQIVVSVVLSPNRFLTLMRDQPLPPEAFVTLMGSDRRVLMRSRDPERFQGASASPTMLRALDANRSGVLTSRSLDGLPTIVAFAPSSISGWTTAVVVPRSVFEATIWQMVSAVLSLFLLLLIGSIAVARHYSKGLASEIGSLENDALALSSGQIVDRRPGTIANLDRVQAALGEASHELHSRADRQTLLINELNHRVKNTLATVQAMAVQTFRGGSDLAQLRAFEQRLVALSGAHDLLTRSTWRAVEMKDILGRCGDQLDGRVVGDGPRVMLAAEAALGLCMILHELQTNSLKYGALSSLDGIVEVSWIEDADKLVFTWRETGGPRVSIPTRKGFGTRLIDRLARTELGGTIEREFRPDGLLVTCRFQVPQQGRRWMLEPAPIIVHRPLDSANGA